ncbi:MAG TPA: cobalamin-dependent protein, partial [Polyangiaceae bacterium]|nr:cobalamin-dependent protein [Polyangiaceae bacterium]
MRALLVYPLFPRTYWGQEYTHALTGRRAVLPPLGLLTAAALLPAEWELRLVDMNVEPLTDEALSWADVVMLSAMQIQSKSFHEVVARAHALGKQVVAGGPYVTTDPDGAPDVDYLVLGEAEETLPGFAHAFEAGRAPARVEAGAFPDVTATPIPRFDLVRMEHYNAVGVQYSRGCPFNCEFCDIIEIFGRVPRTKTPEQLLRELDRVHATGFRGAVFVVDDNFIGNKGAARRMLGPLTAWSRAHGYPFDFFTEASVNLAAEDALVDALVEAGFSAVFLGIETPSHEALIETQKRQNVCLDLSMAVDKLTRRGLTVMAGFIVGFDSDGEGIFDVQRDFLARSPIPMALIGILTALPSTQLWRRLAREGRLYSQGVGDTAYRPNFVTKLPERTLV